MRQGEKQRIRTRCIMVTVHYGICWAMQELQHAGSAHRTLVLTMYLARHAAMCTHHTSASGTLLASAHTCRTNIFLCDNKSQVVTSRDMAKFYIGGRESQALIDYEVALGAHKLVGNSVSTFTALALFQRRHQVGTPLFDSLSL